MTSLPNVFPTFSPPTHLQCFFFPVGHNTGSGTATHSLDSDPNANFQLDTCTSSEGGFPNKENLLYSLQECTLVLQLPEFMKFWRLFIYFSHSQDRISNHRTIEPAIHRSIDPSIHRSIQPSSHPPPPSPQSRINRFGHPKRGSVHYVPKNVRSQTKIPSFIYRRRILCTILYYTALLISKLFGTEGCMDGDGGMLVGGAMVT